MTRRARSRRPDAPRVELEVYVERRCASCRRAEEIASDVRRTYEDVVVRLHDVAETDAGPDVFAVPTFVLNGEVYSLGNPSPSDLRRAIDELLDDGTSRTL